MPKEPPYHAILMLPKGQPNEGELKTQLLKHPRVSQVTTSGEAWEQLKGNFRQWPRQVTQEVMGERRFDIMVIYSETGAVAEVGRATGECAKQALAVGMPVYVWRGQGAKRCKRAYCADEKDWKTGWRVE